MIVLGVLFGAAFATLAAPEQLQADCGDYVVFLGAHDALISHDSTHALDRGSARLTEEVSIASLLARSANRDDQEQREHAPARPCNGPSCGNAPALSPPPAPAPSRFEREGASGLLDFAVRPALSDESRFAYPADQRLTSDGHRLGIKRPPRDTDSSAWRVARA